MYLEREHILGLKMKDTVKTARKVRVRPETNLSCGKFYVVANTPFATIQDVQSDGRRCFSV